MASVRGDPAEIWNLYSTISDVRAEMEQECDGIFRMLQVLKDRLEDEKKRTLIKVDGLEAELAVVRNKKAEAREEGNPTEALDAMEEALKARIAALEGKLQGIQQCARKAKRYNDDTAAEKKQCLSSLRRGARRVNKYVKYLESLQFEEDYQKYQASKGDSVAGDHRGKYHAMSFRGNTFYCDDGEVDPDQTDALGRTNLVRMEKGLAPVGSDGLPVNLHHIHQSESGSIIELSETVHTKNHKQLHINTNDIPSGINRSTFNVLKSAYWRRRAAFIRKSRGG